MFIGITNIKSVHNTDANAGRLNGNKSAFNENSKVSAGVSMKQLTLTCRLVSSYIHKKGHWCVQPGYVYIQFELLFLTGKLAVFQQRAKIIFNFYIGIGRGPRTCEQDNEPFKFIVL